MEYLGLAYTYVIKSCVSTLFFTRSSIMSWKYSEKNSGRTSRQANYRQKLNKMTCVSSTAERKNDRTKAATASARFSFKFEPIGGRKFNTVSDGPI